MLLLLCVKHICAGITYGIDVKSSNSKLLKTHFGRLSSAGGKPGQYSVKPRNPTGEVKPLFAIFASMPQAQLDPVRQRYVASREANRFTDWAIMG